LFWRLANFQTFYPLIACSERFVAHSQHGG
jgi:hypothetical protein